MTINNKTKMTSIIAITFFVGIMLIPVGMNSASANTTTVVLPTDSSMTIGDMTSAGGTAPSTNYVNYPQLQVSSDVYYNSEDNRKSWIKFEIPNNGTIIDAQLVLYAERVSDNPHVKLYKYTSNDWDESTITFNNEPSHYAGLTGLPSVDVQLGNSNSSYSVNVTALIADVTQGDSVTFVLANAFANSSYRHNGAYFSHDRNDTSTFPQLVLTIEPLLTYCGQPESSYNRIDGTESSDILTGTDSADLIFGYGGHDLILGKDGNDCIFGGNGADLIKSGGGNDTIYGGGGSDYIKLGSGTNFAYGEAGLDILYSQSGSDTLDGGTGSPRDICTSNASATTFVNCEVTDKP